VAGRLGHGGGGTTTLKVYSAFVAEADQRAAGSLATRMPELPVKLVAKGGALAVPEPRPEVAEETENSPYRRIAADLRGAITSGILQPGALLPTLTDLMARYKVSHGTAHRAVAMLAAEGLVAVRRGHRATVATRPAEAGQSAEVINIRTGRRSNKT
jgi:DNA-binding transcriptional regulator YhcF (GntR family)